MTIKVRLEPACDAAELDAQWLVVGRKSNQHWLWHAVDHATNTVLGYIFGKKKIRLVSNARHFRAKAKASEILPFHFCHFSELLDRKIIYYCKKGS